MLSKSTLQRIRRAYISKKGSVLFDNEGIDRFHIARLILVDATFGRSVVITLSRLYDGRLRVHSFEGSIAYHEIQNIIIALSNNHEI